MAKTTPVRAFVEDIPDLTRLRLQLSLSQSRDVSTAEAIRWMLNRPEIQQIIKNKRAADYRK